MGTIYGINQYPAVPGESLLVADNVDKRKRKKKRYSKYKKEDESSESEKNNISK